MGTRSSLYFAITDALIFMVSGRDAQRYLNARLTNNIRDLAVGAGCIGAALSPQGRTEGLYAVIRRGTEEFTVYCDGGNKEEVLPALKRYIVADRVTVSEPLEPATLLHVVSPAGNGLSDLPPATPAREAIVYESGGWLYVSRQRTPQMGFDIVLPASAIQEARDRFALHGIPEISATERHLLRIAAKMPQYPDELGQDILFSESQLLSAVSFTKGCYVGQEIVEKIDSHGKAPYLIRTFSVSQKLDMSEELEIEMAVEGGSRKTVGTVLSLASEPDSNTTCGFARLRNTPAVLGSPLFIGEMAVTLL